MGQYKHYKGNVGGGVDISHKSKMSGKAKNQMSFPGGMPGPGDYGKMEQPAKIVGKGMARYLAGESVGMRKMDPMYNGKPGVQQDDFEQFGAPKSTGPGKIDPKRKYDKSQYKSSTGRQEKFDKLSTKDQDAIVKARMDRAASSKKKADAKKKRDKASKQLDTYLKSGGQINSGPGKYDPKKKKGKLPKSMKDEAIANKKKIKGKGEKAGGPMKTDPAKAKKSSKEVVVSGDKSKVSKKTTGMSTAEKKAEIKRRIEFKKKVNEARRQEKINERDQMKQVQKDKKSNEKVQRQRRSEGKDYVKYKKGTSKDGSAKESVVVRKKLKK